MIEWAGAGSIPLTYGSGSGSRRPKIMWIRIRNIAKNIWILRIRIRIQIITTNLIPSPVRRITKRRCPLSWRSGMSGEKRSWAARPPAPSPPRTRNAARPPASPHLRFGSFKSSISMEQKWRGTLSSFSLYCALPRVADPDPNWIRIQLDQWIRIRIRIQEDKTTHKSRKKLRNFMFWSAGCSLLRVKGLFCNLYVLYGGLGIHKL